MQETHGAHPDLEDFAKLHPRFLLYGTLCENPSTGGCVLVVAKTLAQPSLGILPQVLAEGRSTQVQLTFPDSELNLICLPVDPAMSLAAMRLLVDHTFGTRLTSPSTVSCVMGDLNTDVPGD